MKEFEKFAQENGFELTLGRWNFVYTEGERKLTLPVEMLMRGDFLWELSKGTVKAWDAPFNAEKIDQLTALRILDRVARFVELTGKKVRIY